ncbi:MAG: hypothetical protein DI551_07630 [Micavibrio aeruginosavorus]|uniref:Uncharacterized protein n=1 Tax=Micavibrio aeruginosavorus TaxID=349221 RepID=A0A2W5MVY1_9BACT|nr:MAG: hypothetical protein DI551_07630 [Micavibrio aeruginosavorus]
MKYLHGQRNHEEVLAQAAKRNWGLEIAIDFAKSAQDFGKSKFQLREDRPETMLYLRNLLSLEGGKIVLSDSADFKVHANLSTYDVLRDMDAFQRVEAITCIDRLEPTNQPVLAL